MNLNHYRFDLQWRLEHPRRRVFDALVDLDSYPSWWPDYRQVSRVDHDTVAIALRSTLPFTLRLTNRLVARDAQQGHFRLALDGDIAGWLDFRLSEPGEGSTRVHITQDCTAEKALLRVLAPVGRRAFAHNHALTMRRGRAGLDALLSRRADGPR